MSTKKEENKEDPKAEEAATGVPQEEQDAFKQLVDQSSSQQDTENNDKENIDDSNNNIYPYKVARLDDICVSFISTNFNEYPILDNIPSQYIENIVNNIDLSKLLINRVAKHVTCSKLWERMSCERWENCNIELHGSNWKRLYLEKHINELLESYYPSESSINLDRLLSSISCCSSFIHTIKLNELQSHLDLSLILPLFKNLSSLDITYKILNAGMNYNEEDFGMNLNDALNISKYLQSKECSLSTLILNECLIDDETIHILMGGLQQNNTITNLDLSKNNISDVGIRRLSSYLSKKDGNVLMILRLNNNKINNEGIKYISSSLNVSHLTELDLSLNNISDQGAINLFEAVSISTSESLININLSCNHITNKSFPAFINCLKVNQSLQTLNLNGNTQFFEKIKESNNNPSSSSSGSTNNSRPQSQQLSSRSALDQGNNINPQFVELKEVLINGGNQTLIFLNLLHCGLSKLEIKTLNKILKPRQIKRKQAQRKNFIDKSWQRLQTVLTIK